ncbi:MAG: OPT/YSL family transporter, partial [Candidatus Thorarchaeota archaeon]
GVAASAAWVGATKIAEGSNPGSLMAVPNMFKSIIPAAGAIPEWIGITNSPLLASIGFFVGWKRAIVIFVGSIASILIWIFLEGALPITYEQHLKRAEILYLSIGVFVSVMASDVGASRKKETKSDEFEETVDAPSIDSEEEGEGIVIETPISSEVPRLKRVEGVLFSIEAMREEMRAMATNPRAYLRDSRGQLPIWVTFISLILYAIVGILIFWIVPIFPNLHIHWSMFVIGTPLVVISAYFTARAICETGMLAGYISDMVAIPAVLMLRLSFQSVTVFMSMLETLQVAAIALLVHLKLGRFTGVRGRDIAKAVSIGMVLSTFVGSLMIYAIYVTYGFGGSEFPSPAAQLFGFIVLSLQGIGNLQIPGANQFPGMPPELVFLYLILFSVAGFIAGRELGKRDMSPMSFVVGVLIPPATAVAMLFGAYIDYRVKKQDGFQPDPTGYEIKSSPLRKKMSRILSGIVAGEAIVVAIWVIWSAIILFV